MKSIQEEHESSANEQPRLWLLVLTTRDHPGDTAAIASIFSGRGIQIDSFIGFGSIKTEDDSHEGRIMLTFYAYSERCQHLCRILESLEAVIAVRCCLPDAAVNELLLQAQNMKMLLGAM